MATKSYWARFQRGRISRRRLIGTAGVGAAGLAVVAACGGGGGGGDETPGKTPEVLAPTSTPASQPQAGGRFQSARNAVYDTLDPHLSVASLGTFPRVYNVLIKQSALKPEVIIHDLADEFEAPEPGGTEWIFHIRPGVKIAPNQLGVPERDMDAEDALVAYERIQTGGPDGGELSEATACAFICNWFDTHEAPDLETYTVRTPTPYAWFLAQIGGTNFFQNIPPRELIQQDPDRMQTTGVGGGPFSIVGYGEAEFLTLEKNPNYYGRDPNNNNAQLPYIDGWDTKVVPDPAAVRVAFESQQAYTYGAQNRAEVEELLSRYDVHEGATRPVFSYISLAMNVTRPPWDNPKIRKAAMHAINRQQYIDIIYGGEAQGNGIVHWPVGAYALPPEELELLQPFDPQLSRQLITEAGHTLPLKVTVIFPTGDFLEGDQHLAIWLEQMAAAGFEVDQQAMDLGSWIVEFTAKNYDASLHPNLAYETPEFPLDFQHSNGPAGSGIFSNGLQDPEVDAEIEATKEITNSEELVDAIQKVQRVIYDKGPADLPIVSPFTRSLIWNFVKNFPTDLGTADALLNDWWLEGAPS